MEVVSEMIMVGFQVVSVWLVLSVWLGWSWWWAAPWAARGGGGVGSRCAALSQRQQVEGRLVACLTAVVLVGVRQLLQAAQHFRLDLGGGWSWRWRGCGEGFGLLAPDVAGQANTLPAFVLPVRVPALWAVGFPREEVTHGLPFQGTDGGQVQKVQKVHP